MATVSKGRAVWSVVMGQWGTRGREVMALVAWQVAQPQTKEVTKCYDIFPLYVYDTLDDSYRTLGLLTPVCLPLLRCFSMAVAFYVQSFTQQ